MEWIEGEIEENLKDTVPSVKKYWGNFPDNDCWQSSEIFVSMSNHIL